MKVYEAVANAFIREGTTTIFGLLGDGQLSWSTVLAKHAGIRIVDARNEDAALTMAEGWARVSGKTGVCSVTHGPGLSRATTSLITASRARTPIVVFTSRAPEDNLQHLNQERLVSATGAGYIEVLNPANAEHAVRQAFYRAQVESRPIVLAVPVEIQGRECDSDGDEYQTSASLFSGQQCIRPDVHRLNAAVKIIEQSRRPVVLLGRGARDADAVAAARSLARRIGALTATTLHAKGAFGAEDYSAGISGLFSTRTAIQLFAEADCVIAVGASLSSHTLQGGYLYQEARVIQVDVAPHVQMGNERGADCYIQGDAAITIRAIEEMLSHGNVTMEGFRTPDVRRILQTAPLDAAEFEIEEGTVDPREAVRLMDERLPSDVGVVTGVGHYFSFPVMEMNKPRPLYLSATAFACIGQGLATAIGACVALGKPLVCVEGDASAMQYIQELDTAARLNLKLLFVVMNDEALGAEYHKLKADGRDTQLSWVRSPDLGAVGRGFGCHGRVARNLPDVQTGLDEFLAGDGPYVLDIRVSRNVISIPYRRLHFGQDV